MIRRLLLILPLFTSILSSAQDRLKFISFESGYDFLDCGRIDKDYVRAVESTSSYDYEYDNNGMEGIGGTMRRFHAAVKLEVRSRNNKFGFFTGLRYTQLSSAVEREEGPDYYYVLLGQSGARTDYLRIKELSQASSFVSVPVEVRMYPFGTARRLSFNFAAGGELGFLAATKNSAEFITPAMSKYSSGVSDLIGKPGSLYTSFYGRVGFTIGKEKPLFGVGVTVPLIVISSSSSLVTPDIGAGFSIQIQKQL